MTPPPATATGAEAIAEALARRLGGVLVTHPSGRFSITLPGRLIEGFTSIPGPEGLPSLWCRESEGRLRVSYAWPQGCYPTEDWKPITCALDRLPAVAALSLANRLQLGAYLAQHALICAERADWREAADVARETIESLREKLGAESRWDDADNDSGTYRTAGTVPGGNDCTCCPTVRITAKAHTRSRWIDSTHAGYHARAELEISDLAPADAAALIGLVLDYYAKKEGGT
jgi:hypothetical protein